MKHIESFGPVKFYGRLIPLIVNNRHQWRKVARMLVKLRFNAQQRGWVCRETQLESAQAYVQQALKDTILPEYVKAPLRWGIASEFGFKF
jgi:hypothetical protein